MMSFPAAAVIVPAKAKVGVLSPAQRVREDGVCCCLEQLALLLGASFDAPWLEPARALGMRSSAMPTIALFARSFSESHQASESSKMSSVGE